jgi:hypothetical protein
MKNNWITRSSALLILSTFSIISLGTFTARVARADGFCECVAYVQNRFGIYTDKRLARESIDTLGNLGFTQVSTAVPGAIVVMQSSFPGLFPKTAYAGHIAVIDSYDPSTGKISTRGANQTGDSSSEYDCNNVTTTPWGTDVRGRQDISYWVRDGFATEQSTVPNNPQPDNNLQQPDLFGSSNNNNPQPDTQQSNIHLVNFSATVMSTSGITLRTDTNLFSESDQTVNYQQRLSLDAWAYGDAVEDLQTGQPDARWYRIKGTTYWVPSAYVNGNAPGSSPSP